MRVSGRVAWGLLFASLLVNVFFGGIVVARYLPPMFGPPPKPPLIRAIYHAAESLDQPARGRVLAAWEKRDDEIRASFEALHRTTSAVLADLATHDLSDAEIAARLKGPDGRVNQLGVAMLTGLRDATASLTPPERKAFYRRVLDEVHRVGRP